MLLLLQGVVANGNLRLTRDKSERLSYNYGRMLCFHLSKNYSMTKAAVNPIMGSGLISEDPRWLEELPLGQWNMSRDDWRQAP